jgi:hypothetical protein
MPKVVKSVAALVAFFMVFAPLSALACDLSCWLNQVNSDCHSAKSAAEEDERGMFGATGMDMGSGAAMGSHIIRGNMNPNYREVSAAHHSMPAQMDMVRSSMESFEKSDASSSAEIDRSKAIPACSHEACSQVSASAFSPSAHRVQPADRQCMSIHVSTPADLAKRYRWVSGTAPPANHLLPTLRI